MASAPLERSGVVVDELSGIMFIKKNVNHFSHFTPIFIFPLTSILLHVLRAIPHFGYSNRHDTEVRQIIYHVLVTVICHMLAYKTIQ